MKLSSSNFISSPVFFLSSFLLIIQLFATRLNAQFSSQTHSDYFLIIAHLSAVEELIPSNASWYVLIINAALWLSYILNIDN